LYNGLDVSGRLVMDDDRALTVREAAERLAAPEPTVRRWLREGKLRGIRPGGTKTGWRIALSEIRRFLRGEEFEGKVRAA
jgi:excisionase family DNA binding protein